VLAFLIVGDDYEVDVEIDGGEHGLHVYLCAVSADKAVHYHHGDREARMYVIEYSPADVRNGGGSRLVLNRARVVDAIPVRSLAERRAEPRRYAERPALAIPRRWMSV
jgi:hypothetical protein